MCTSRSCGASSATPRGSARCVARVTSWSRREMTGSGLRSRLFRAIGVVVLICVALTLGLGVVLTRRAVQQAALKDVGHQADLIAAELQSSVLSLHTLQKRIGPALNRQHELVVYDPRDLPSWAQSR